MIYCDHNASTPVRPEVLEAMLPFLREEFGNPSSVHRRGSAARCAIEEARGQVAELLGVPPAEIVFTSGGTESNNLAILGAARATGRRGIVTTPIEHSSVGAAMALLAAEGFRVSELPVDECGRVTAASLDSCIDSDSGLVSIAWANNEIGTIQPMESIAQVCRARGVVLHTDAVQAAAKIPLRGDLADLVSISAHKLGGAKGTGALRVRRGVPLQPLFAGGGQERGLRAGTENVAGIVALGAACQLARGETNAYGEGCSALRERLWQGLRSVVPDTIRNGALGSECLPNTLHLNFAGVRGEALVAALDLQGIAVSSGSACAAGAGEPSHVLLAVGRDSDAARNGVRFSFGRRNSIAEVDTIIDAVAAAVQRIRESRRDGARP